MVAGVGHPDFAGIPVAEGFDAAGEEDGTVFGEYIGGERECDVEVGGFLCFGGGYHTNEKEKK